MAIISWLAAAGAKYGAIAFGVVLGFLARYASLLDEGRKITGRTVVVDLLILGMVTSIATATAELCNIPEPLRTPFGTLFGFSGMWICRFASRRFQQEVTARLGVQADA